MSNTNNPADAAEPKNPEEGLQKEVVLVVEQESFPWAKFFKIGSGVILLVCLIVAVAPLYRIYVAWADGQAVLARAQHSRQAEVLQAQAKREAAQHLAEAVKIANKAGISTAEFIEIQRIIMIEDVGPKLVLYPSGSNTPPVVLNQ